MYVLPCSPEPFAIFFLSSSDCGGVWCVDAACASAWCLDICLLSGAYMARCHWPQKDLNPMASAPAEGQLCSSGTS
jgi:hypothetical protein